MNQPAFHDWHAAMTVALCLHAKTGIRRRVSKDRTLMVWRVGVPA